LPRDLVGFEAGLFESECVCILADRADLGFVEPVVGDSRPGVAQTALALARIMDNPKVVGSQTAAKVLTALLEKLHSASARGRRGGLAVVRTMTEKGGA
jgi:hypothetical protein